MSANPRLSVPTSNAIVENTSTYSYLFANKVGRLTNVNKDNQEVETYTYDNNGNRQSATVNGTSINASYTLDDNLVVYGDNSYSYDDDENRGSSLYYLLLKNYKTRPFL